MPAPPSQITDAASPAPASDLEATGDVAAGDAEAEAPAPKRKRTALWVSLGIAALVVVVGIGVVVATTGGSNISMPTTVAGEPQLDSPAAQVLVTGIKEQIKKDTSSEVLAGMYGTAAVPKFMVVAVDQAAPPGAGDPLEQMGRAAGQDLGSDTTLDTSSITRKTVGSTTYECAPATVTSNGSTVNLEICTWEDDQSFGMVFTLDPGVYGMDVVVKAHDDVVS